MHFGERVPDSCLIGARAISSGCRSRGVVTAPPGAAAPPYQGAARTQRMRVGVRSVHISPAAQSDAAHVQCATAMDPGGVVHVDGSTAQ